MNDLWSVESPSENVHFIDIAAPWDRRGFEFTALITSDWHYDNPHCDRALLRKHLDEAKRIGAPVIVNGDLFCVMQGKKDKRGSKPDVRPEHQVADYYDAVVRTTAEDMEPYADILAVAGYGNHETSIIKHQETDVLRNFVYKMNREYGSPLQLGGYGGWIFFRFIEPGSKRKVKTIRMKYFHGSGGGGPVTKGVIQTNRRAVIYPEADIITSGHIHEKWALRTTQERITKQGRVYLKDQLHLLTSAYKEESGSGAKGWHVERGAPPKPLGGYWLKFTSNLKKQVNGRQLPANIVFQEYPTV